MRKFIVVGLVLLILISVGFAIESFEEKIKDKIKYTVVKEKEVVGYKPVFVDEHYQITSCIVKQDKDTGENVSYTCKNKSRSRRVVDPYQQGNPIYKYSKTLKIINRGKEFNFEDYNGVECGEYLLMISRKDGGMFLQDVRFDTYCDGERIKESALDGVDCWMIYDLKTNNLIGEKQFDYCKI